ncbi:MAG: hypothetical protein A3I06_08390 [Candidatus Lindowbacteria bacterium RIFCSPLOWO2_02_FULL_62_12]|nr:MAG: hypothetical protein A3I06_08390 [Candidatus Lindowbacteria bacterium RIFCSPLOWO2_02_FULL_62_12]
MDDPHFAAAGVPADEVHGLFVTEESGHRLGVFPIDSGLKNLIPDKSPKETINYLENLSEEHPGTVVAFMGDGAVAARLIPALAREKFLAPVTPTEWAAGHAPRRLLYVPSASSAEMSEWILPPGLEDEYAGFKSQVVRHTRASAQRLFLRGGFWRAFLTKYAESNWMQKRVFAAATKMGPVLEKLGADREARAIRDLLDRAACHDAYWHGAGAGRGNGPAGGFYAPPIRAAVWRNLLEAETRFSKKMGLFPACFSDDIDCDGEPEWMVYTESWVIGFKPRLGGGMIEWSYRPALHNFQNTVTRRPERDHAQLERHPRLVYDRYRKASGLVYALDSGVRFEQFARQDLPEQAPAVGETQAKAEEKAESFSLKFRREAGPFVFEKHVVISKHESKLSLQVSVCASPGSAPWRLGLGFELFYARLEDLVVEGSLLEGSARSRSVSVTDRGGGTTVVMKFDREVEVWLAPVWTISKSMDGVQETFQGISVLFLGDDAGAGVKQELTMNVEVKSIAGTQA